MGLKIICDDCRKKLAKVLKTISSESRSEFESGSEAYYVKPLASLNQCLGEIGETPVSKHKLQQTKYAKQVKKITTAMKRVMIRDVETDDDEGEIIRQLKEKFHATTEMGEGPVNILM